MGLEPTILNFVLLYELAGPDKSSSFRVTDLYPYLYFRYKCMHIQNKAWRLKQSIMVRLLGLFYFYLLFMLFELCRSSFLKWLKSGILGC